MVAKSEILDPAVADAAFSLPSGEVSQPVQGQFGVAAGQDRQDRARGRTVPMKPSRPKLKKEIATERARNKVAELRDKMEDERGGGASVDRSGARSSGLPP